MKHHSFVGNGTFGGILDERGRYVWCCMNHFGGDPIFNSLLNNDSVDTGFFEVCIDNFISSTQKYVPLTSVVVTTLKGESGVVEVTDFAPKFTKFDRTFRPFQVFRIIRKVSGDPVIKIKIRPTFGYNSYDGYRTRGSHHIRYCGPTVTWRVTTTMSVQYIADESAYIFDKEGLEVIVFGTDESFADSLRTKAMDFRDATILYWQNFTFRLRLPFNYQNMVARACICLAVQQSEECGGLLSSLTMGHPIGREAITPAKDGRVCRLLDECLSIGVLRDVGLFEIARKFLEFIKNSIYRTEEPQHSYGALGELSVPQEKMPYLAGYKGLGEVINGGIVPHDSSNHAEHLVVYGLAVVALVHCFFDIRLEYLATDKLVQELERLAGKALQVYEQLKEEWYTEDAHIAAFPPHANGYFDDCPSFYNVKGEGADKTPHGDGRGSNVKVHTFTTALCWAACDRVGRIMRMSGHSNSKYSKDEKKKQAEYWSSVASEMREEILRASWNTSRNAFCSYWGGDIVGPSVLRMVELGILKEDDPRFRSTTSAYEEDAFRAAVSPNTFTTSTLLWYAEALRICGRLDESHNLLDALSETCDYTGGFSEAIEWGMESSPSQQWGNFPFTSALLNFLRVSLRLPPHSGNYDQNSNPIFAVSSAA